MTKRPLTNLSYFSGNMSFLFDTEHIDKEDLTFFVKKALQSKISWTALKYLFEDINSRNDRSKQMIEVLIDSLEELHSNLRNGRVNEIIDKGDEYVEIDSENQVYNFVSSDEDVKHSQNE